MAVFAREKTSTKTVTTAKSEKRFLNVILILDLEELTNPIVLVLYGFKEHRSITAFVTLAFKFLTLYNNFILAPCVVLGARFTRKTPPRTTA
jgi:hypothetical protein